MTDRLPRLAPSLHTVRLLLAPALVFIVTGLDRGYQTELWQHLARGRLVAREGLVVSVERFTFTVPGLPLRDNNWLTQLLYYCLYAAGGLELVQVVNSLVLAAAMGGLVLICRRESASTRVAAAVGVLTFFGLWQTLLIRPQTFSVLFFVSLYGLLRSAPRRPMLLALVPPLMALWANVHGGFAVGLLLLGTFAVAAVAQRIRLRGLTPAAILPWPACLVASVLSTLLNPYGWGVYQYAGHLSALGVERGIEEWLPPSAGSLVGVTFFLSVAAVGALAVRTRREVTFQDVCILGCFVVPACMSVRMTVWWFLAAAPVVARWVGTLRAPSIEQQASRPSWPAALATAAIMAACVGSMPWLERHSPLMRVARSAHRVESDLAALARPLAEAAGSAPRVFTRMEWANFLAWQSDGRAKVFVEGHVELYPAETWREYVTVNDARPGWAQVLRRHQVRFLILDQTYHSALLSDVRRSDEWENRGRSGEATLFERVAPLELPLSGLIAPAAGDF